MHPRIEVPVYLGAFCFKSLPFSLELTYLKSSASSSQTYDGHHGAMESGLQKAIYDCKRAGEEEPRAVISNLVALPLSSLLLLRNRHILIPAVFQPLGNVTTWIDAANVFLSFSSFFLPSLHSFLPLFLPSHLPPFLHPFLIFILPYFSSSFSPPHFFLSSSFLPCFFLLSATEFSYLAQAGLELTILLPQPPRH